MTGKSLVSYWGMTFALFASVGLAEGPLKDRIRIQKRAYVSRNGVNAEEYQAEKQAVLASKRKGLILDIKRFLAEARSVDQKTELNLRLAALYMEDYYAGLALAQTTFEKETAAYEANKKGKTAPKLDNSDAYASLEKARVIYKDLAKRFPSHPRYDEMLYFLAVSSMDRGKNTEAVEYFQQLIQNVPNSKFAAEALVQVGDHYFDNNQFPTAEGFYDRIIAKKHKALMAYAVYKKAWCSYNQSKTAQALHHFKWVIANEEKLQGGATRLKSEALRDITLPFVDLRQVDEAVAYFKEQGDQAYKKGLETLGQLYFEAGEYKSSVKLYSLLLQFDPNNPKNPSFEISIVEALRLSNNAKLAVEHLFNRMPIYLAASTWHEINNSTPSVIAEANRLFEESAVKYALQFHAEAQKMKNTEMYELSKLLYGKYLEAFPRSAQAAKIRFYLAEIHYKQNEFVPAAHHYYLTYQDPNSGNLRFDSIRYALTSLDRELNAERRKAGLTEISAKSSTKIKEGFETSLELIPYSEVENKFISIGAEFLAQFPTAKEAPDVAFETAYLQYQHHDFEAAAKGFAEIIAKYPTHSGVYTAANLTLDILNRHADYPRLISVCQGFLKNTNLAKPEFRADVSDVLRKAELKRISLIENAGDHKKAAEEYIEYTKSYGAQDESLFEKALYNASVNYTRAALYLAAVETQERFLRRFPKSPYREDMLLQVAKTYELMANFEKAGTYFEQFASQYPANAQAKNALRVAGIYFWGAGNIAKAEQIMTGYLRTYPADTKQVDKDLIDLYESTQSYPKLVAMYQKARFEKGVSFADQLNYTLKIADLYQKQNGKVPAQLMEEGFKMVATAGKTLNESPKGIEAMSKFLFWNVARQEAEFYKVKLVLPQATLERNMQRKLQLLKELEKEYVRIAGLGSGEWGLASIYRAAAAYQHMSAEITAAPVPSELTAEQLDTYRAEIQKQMVTPFNEKSLAFVNQCLDKSQEFNLLSSWTARCYSLASTLDPQRFPRVRSFYLPAAQLAVFSPNKADSKIPRGDVKTFSYPFYSSTLFAGPETRILASMAPMELPGMSEGQDADSVVPELFTYRLLSDERKKILAKEYGAEKYDDVKKMTFAQMNIMRLLNPKRAQTLILSAIELDPTNSALHNLLALAYLEQANLTGAKVTLLSLLARGEKNAAIYNNLGVVFMLEGKEKAALDIFTEATTMENPREALLNLAFTGLKYRNGFDARKHFEKALEIEKDDVTAQVGFAVAKLQNRQLDEAKESLVSAVKRYKSDPYARLSTVYYLMDVEKEYGLSGRMAAEYMNSQGSESDLQFRQAIQEAKSRAPAGSGEAGGLPDLD